MSNYSIFDERYNNENYVNESSKEKNKEKDLGTKFADSVEINSRKMWWNNKKKIDYEKNHPIKTGIKQAGGMVGTYAGASIAGPGGAVVGNQIGQSVGKFVGNIGEDVAKIKFKKKPKTLKKENVDFSNIYRSNEFRKAMNEYFDINDTMTRKVLLAIDENDQNKVLASLTSKLYDNIVNKVDDIDFGEIPMSKGDITKLSNYQALLDCNNTMSQLLKEFKQDTEPVDTIFTAIDNIRNSTNIWKRAFTGNIELPMVMYNTIVLAIIEATTYLITMCIEYIKIPSEDSFQLVIDKSALSRSKDHMIFDNLRKFNDSYKKGQITSAMEYIIKENVKNFTGEIGMGTALFGITAILFCIIPILRELIFLFYYTRVRISEYFETQANLLQMNAYNVEQNRIDLTKEQKKNISKKQIKIAERMRTISKKFAVEMKESEVKASKDIASENKKQKIDDVVDELPDSASSLF